MTRERAIEAWNLLNDFIASLAAATSTIQQAALLEPRLQQKLPHPEVPIFLFMRRMGLRYIVIYLFKWHEFYKRYKRVIPRTCVEEFAHANDEIVRRGVIEYRNKCVGHIYDRVARRPITEVEEDEFIRKITGDNALAFLEWINSGPPREGNRSLLYIAERTRNEIEKAWSLTSDDLGLRPGSKVLSGDTCA